MNTDTNTPIIIRSQIESETGNYTDEERDTLVEQYAEHGTLMASSPEGNGFSELRITRAPAGGWLVYYIDETVSFVHLWPSYEAALDEIRQTVIDLDIEAQSYNEDDDAAWFTWTHSELTRKPTVYRVLVTMRDDFSRTVWRRWIDIAERDEITEARLKRLLEDTAEEDAEQGGRQWHGTLTAVAAINDEEEVDAVLDLSDYWMGVFENEKYPSI